MPKTKIIIPNLKNARPEIIPELVHTACQYQSSIYLHAGNQRINAKSIMGAMAFQVEEGMHIEISTEGDDAEEALNALAVFLTEERVK